MMPSTTVPTEVGSMAEPRYPVHDAMQGIFSFGASGFQVNHISRESGKRLRKLLFPELLKNEKARKLARDDASIIETPWVKAQLQHYGVDFKPDIDPFKAKALLLTSIAYGLCDVVPPQVLKIKTTLNEEYTGMHQDYRDKMKAYRAEQLPKRIQKFEACTNPSEEAKCDASLFLRKYFLTDDGDSDRTKTPDVILLPGYTDKGLVLTGRTERVPGLHVANGGLGGESNVMVVGWDRERVNRKAQEIDMQQTFGRGILRLKHNWNRQMEIHHEYEAELRNQAGKYASKASSSFEIHDVGGNYVVACEAIQHDWPLLSKQMQIRIVIYGRLAIFDLGIVLGLMVLGKTQEHVTKLLQDDKWDADPFDDVHTDDESDSEDASSDEQNSNDERANTSSKDSDYDVGDSSNTPAHFTSARPTKRQGVENSHPRRLYLQWRGYNTMSGAIQFDPQNRNTGYLDFANDNATKFRGKILMAIDGTRSEISFEGYRVPGFAGPLTMDWNAFSHLASERVVRANVRELFV